MIPLSNMGGSYILPGYYVYTYGDVLKPGSCTRLRWDPAVLSTPAAKPYLRVFTSPQSLCGNTGYVISTTSYSPGWRYALVGNSLVPLGPLPPDYAYAQQLLDLLNLLSQLNRNFTRYLNAALGANATALNATGLYASMPQFLGTIKMSSATSTWLKTVYNAIRSYIVSMPTGGGSAPVSAPAAPMSTAPAAAAAVAVAWAASRRDDDVATTAAVAGIALALFGILMTLIYGTSSLTLVALGIIVAAAAAAWKKI
jgi:hypothetical protein